MSYPPFELDSATPPERMLLDAETLMRLTLAFVDEDQTPDDVECPGEKSTSRTSA